MFWVCAEGLPFGRRCARRCRAGHGPFSLGTRVPRLVSGSRHTLGYEEGELLLPDAMLTCQRLAALTFFFMGMETRGGPQPLVSFIPRTETPPCLGLDVSDQKILKYSEVSRWCFCIRGKARQPQPCQRVVSECV